MALANDSFRNDFVIFKFFNPVGQVQMIGFGGQLNFSNEEIQIAPYLNSVGVTGDKTAEGLYYHSEVKECEEVSFDVRLWDNSTQGKLFRLLDAVPRAFRTEMTVNGYHVWDETISQSVPTVLNFDVGIDFDRTSYEVISLSNGLVRNAIRNFTMCRTEVPPIPSEVPPPVIIRDPSAGTITIVLTLGGQ